MRDAATILIAGLGLIFFSVALQTWIQAPCAFIRRLSYVPVPSRCMCEPAKSATEVKP